MLNASSSRAAMPISHQPSCNAWLAHGRLAVPSTFSGMLPWIFIPRTTNTFLAGLVLSGCNIRIHSWQVASTEKWNFDSLAVLD